MEPINEMLKQLSELQERGKSTNQLHKMNKNELSVYEK